MASTARWRGGANLKSPIGSPTSVSCKFSITFVVYRSPFTCFRHFYPCKLRPDVVLAAWLCHRQILMLPIDSAASVSYRRSLENVRLSCTVEKLCDIFCCAFNLAVILPFKQTFVNLTFEMTPSPTFLITHFVCRDAHREP